MQWILQDYEDTSKLAEILERAGLTYSMHKVVPFIGEMEPHPVIADPNKVIMFGSYSLRHYARKYGLTPGVFELQPFLHEHNWQPYLLNGVESKIIMAKHLGSLDPNRDYFVRPVEDSKEIAGAVMTGSEIEYMIKAVNNLKPEEYIVGSLTPDTLLMVADPINIQKEWRVWVVKDQVITYSLYKMGNRVIYRAEIDDDALEFVQHMVELNKGYSGAYVIDICRTADGLHILETNCINAAGFYAADMAKLVGAFEQF